MTEHDNLCVLITQYLNLIKNKEEFIFFHIPNESKSSFAWRNKQKRVGCYFGAFDFCIVHQNKTIFIEVKSKKDTLNYNQQRFYKDISEKKIYGHVIRSFEEFQSIIKDFLKSVS